MKGLALLGVTSAIAFLLDINLGPGRASAAEVREVRCTMALSVFSLVAARDTSILMLASAKSDSVYAGGEAGILSRHTLLMARNRRVFGQVMLADSFVGPGSDHVRAALVSSGSRDIVVVPWGHGISCEPHFWSGTARFASPDQEGVYFLQLRHDSLWVERRPTFDALYAQVYSYAPGTGIPGPDQKVPGDTSIRRGTEPRQLFQIYERMPASPGDTLRARRLREWLQDNPAVRNTYPANSMLPERGTGIS